MILQQEAHQRISCDGCPVVLPPGEGRDVMSAREFEAHVDLLIRSRYSILYIVTGEEERAETALHAVARMVSPPRHLVIWDFVAGFGAAGIAKEDPFQALDQVLSRSDEEAWLFVLRDFHRFIDDVRVTRRLRSLARSLRALRKTVVILSPVLKVPQELVNDVTVIDFPLPCMAEIEAELLRFVGPERNRLGEPAREALIKAALGLPMQRIVQALAQGIATDGIIDDADVALMLEEKKQAIRQTEILEYCAEEEGLEDIGGLDNLKRWLAVRADAFGPRARAYGLPALKGVLLIGVQGTGKSLSARAIARAWRLPLLRLDVGRLMGALVGESEARTRQMMRLAEAMAPCVLWMDELDKAFGTAQQLDGGTQARVMATLLTWMQEKRSPVFIVATANQITHLPPELLRKGRFDEIFFVGLPSDEERREIFELHLKRLRDTQFRQFDLDRLVAVSAGYSGAELACAITDAMHQGFADNREFGTDDIVVALRSTYPLSRTAQEAIDALRDWAQSGRARSASREFVKRPASHRQPFVPPSADEEGPEPNRLP